MRAVIVVETEAEYKAWMAKQQSYYAQTHAVDSSATQTIAKLDSNKAITMNVK